MTPTLQYFLLMFGSCLGIYQIGAAFGGFKGTWFFPSRGLTYVGGLVIFAATYIWFFTCADLKMNANPNHGEVEGFEQLYLFLAGSFLALVINYSLSSLLNMKRRANPEKDPVLGKGMEDLKGQSVLRAFSRRRRLREKMNDGPR